MDFFLSQNETLKQFSKKRLTQDQVRLLEKSFITNKKLKPELKGRLASQLGVPPRQIAIWYQNKRARWKTQSLEIDYNTLQVKLEHVLVEKARLEKVVVDLQGELRKTQEMLFSMNHDNKNNQGFSPPSTTYYNTPCGDGGSSSLNEDANGEVLQLEDLYACLIGGSGPTWA